MFSHCGRVWQYSEPERARQRVDERILRIEVRDGMRSGSRFHLKNKSICALSLRLCDLIPYADRVSWPKRLNRPSAAAGLGPVRRPLNPGEAWQPYSKVVSPCDLS